MPRISRAVGVGLPHHITQRGNYGGVIFESDSDRIRYLNLISEYSAKYSLSILGYCLMSNHVHFIAVPGNEFSMARALNAAHMRYAQSVNQRRRVKGHLWQGRFYSCVLDGNHLLSAARYVERNPVRAGLVEYADIWKWSSAGAHAGMVPDEYGFDLEALWSLIPVEKLDWLKYLRKKEDERVSNEIRMNTRTGRPIGPQAFVKMLEKRLGRCLIAHAVGRPRMDDSGIN